MSAAPDNVVPLRRVTIGGSTAAAACGVDPYRSRIALWLELTGRVERQESEPMRWGTLLQPVIMGELRERGLDVLACDQTFHDPDRPWLVGHPDGWAMEDGDAAVLEVKTTSAYARWDEHIPLTYEAQVQTYLHLTGATDGILACLLGGQRLEIRRVERSDAAIEMMLAMMAEFVGYVERDEPPPPDASKSSRDALTTLYPEHAPDVLRRLTKDEYALVGELRALRAQSDVIGVQVAEKENTLRSWMGDAERCIGPHDEPVATWRSFTERRIDSTRLKTERPDVAAAFTNETRRRRFTLA